jgi:hypothetical protein
MPQPKEGEELQEFVERCIPDVLEHGTAEDSDQAYAICRSIWNEAQEDKAMISLEEYLIVEVKASTEEDKEAQRKRAEKYGIAPKENGNVTKPSEYSNVADGSFGDPVNYKYPADAAHAKPALTYFNHPKMREKGGYSSEEWGIIGRRLAKLISRHLEDSYEYRSGKSQKKEKKNREFVLEEHDSSCTCKGCVEVQFPDEELPVRLALVEEPTGEPATLYVTPVVGEPHMTVVDSDGTDTASYVQIVSVGDPPPTQPEVKDNVELDELKAIDLTRAIKLVDETPDYFTVGGYGHVWGNAKMTDLVGDYFSPSTDLMPDLVPVKLVFFDHALNLAPDGTKMDYPFGRAPEEETRIDDIGKWVQAQISKRAQWVDAVMELVEKGILAWSSGAVPHLVKRAKDGWLQRWPVAEYTMTPTPCEPRSTDVSRLKAEYDAAGLKWLSDNFDAVTLGTESDEELVMRMAVERELQRLRLNIS